MSTIEVWSRPSAPVNPIKVFASDFQVIAMDQRTALNAAKSNRDSGGLAVLRRFARGPTSLHNSEAATLACR